MEKTRKELEMEALKLGFSAQLIKKANNKTKLLELIGEKVEKIVEVTTRINGLEIKGVVCDGKITTADGVTYTYNPL